MAAHRYDLIVIGSGPAGEKGAAQAAYFGKNVALVERDDLGGTAVNTGTLPSKTLRETALYLSGFRQRGLYGVDYTFDREVTIDDLIRREQNIARTHQTLVGENLARHGIEVFLGTASITDPHSVRVTNEHGATHTLDGEHVLIATGSRPFRPSHIRFDGKRVFDSDTILHLTHIPESLAVIGAGVVGTEYATIFGALGTHVTLVDNDDCLLPFLDDEVRQLLIERMRAVNVTVMFNQEVKDVDRPAGDGGVRLELTGGGHLSAGAALFCVGRSGNTEELGLAAAGIPTARHDRIEVNEHFQTSVPNIYAAGDVIGSPALASTSMEQARVAVCHAFGFAYKQQVSDLVPYALYTIPEVSTAGATEQTLAGEGRSYLVGRASYRTNPRAQILGDTTGLIKLLFDPESRRVLGVHIIGEQASELIHIGQACMFYEGTLDFFIQNVFNFPTLSDLYKYAAYDGLGKLSRHRPN